MIELLRNSSFVRLPSRLAIGMIRLYQATLSPDHGPLKDLHPYGFCRHELTCSEYGKKMIENRGVVIGTLMTMKQLLDCHPWKEPSKEKIMKVCHEGASQT